MSDIVERLGVAWEKQPGAAMTKINRILVERKDAIAEITRLRQLLSEAQKDAREAALEEAAKVADEAAAMRERPQPYGEDIWVGLREIERGR